LDYWGTTTPNSAFAFPIGQAISRTTYAKLFALVGTTYGVGDGTTTFNLPDKRGRVSMAVDPTGSIVNSATMTPDGSTLGAKGGAQGSALVTANLPSLIPTGAITNGAITISHNANADVGGNAQGGGPNCVAPTAATITASQAASTFAGNQMGGTSTAFTNMQPTIACNYIIRVI
jgi:microcystin-dependent protein